MRLIHKIAANISVLLALAWPITAHGQNAAPAAKWKQLAKLTESNGKEQDLLGSSVAISRDGNTAAVAAAGWCPVQGHDGCGQGAIFVFVKPPTGWADMTETAMLTASDGQPGEYLGESVAISDDGSTIVAGAPYWPANGKGNGAVYVFTKPQSGWADGTETARLTTADLYATLGQSVAISGNTIAGGGPGFNKNQGAAYVFVQPEGGWENMKQTARLSPSDQGGYVGLSISIDDGTVVAGSFNAPAYVFVRPKNGWRNKTETAELTPSNGKPGYDFGYSVSISGETIAVGSPRYDHNHDKTGGGVYMYVKPEGGWRSMTQTALITVHARSTGLGYSVSLDSGGKGLVAAAPGWPDGLGQGEAALFKQPQSGWRTTSSPSATMAANDGHYQDGLGFSVSGSRVRSFAEPRSPRFAAQRLPARLARLEARRLV